MTGGVSACELLKKENYKQLDDMHTLHIKATLKFEISISIPVRPKEALWGNIVELFWGDFLHI